VAFASRWKKGPSGTSSSRSISLPSGGSRPEHRARHPFGKIPAFEHDGFRLYEAGAITRYVDEALPGPRLQPRGRARMNQIVSTLDSYAYGTLVWDIYVERVFRPGALGERLGE
jgi:glutathione S-transferase